MLRLAQRRGQRDARQAPRRTSSCFVRRSLPARSRTCCGRSSRRASGKKDGVDFHVCFQPEFLREGSSIRDYDKPPFTIVGATHACAGRALRELFGHLPCEFITTSVRSAEMVKYCCNNFHALKITFANETARLCEALGVDPFEVMDLVCKDTAAQHLAGLSEARLRLRRLVPAQGPARHDASREDARRRPADARRRSSPPTGAHLEHAIAEGDWRPASASIGMIGLSFKTGTDDLRESPLVTARRASHRQGACRCLSTIRRCTCRNLLGANRRFIEQHVPHIGQLAAPRYRRGDRRARRCSSSA